ncbi:MAG: rRNA methyltransferase [Flavobacteriaceae bacterium]|nr:MAG: rRNA methyltransferase [Flavobacteriaceae bacterium]
MHKKIESLQNPLIKQLIKLKEKSRERKKLGLFLIEGTREISLALMGNYQLKTLLISEEVDFNAELSSLNLKSEVEIITLSKEVYKKLAYRESTEGLIAVAHSMSLELNSLKFNSNTPLVLIAEAPEKPGNIGALLRTADAANIDAVIIANPKTDLYNQNVVRSSVGCVFTTQIAMGTSKEILTFLKEKNIAIYGAALTASIPYTDVDFKQASAIVMGTEATGLSEEFLSNTTQNIIIPMRGKIDSMNVSVSAAIIIFEATRQRNL